MSWCLFWGTVIAGGVCKNQVYLVKTEHDWHFETDCIDKKMVEKSRIAAYCWKYDWYYFQMWLLVSPDKWDIYGESKPSLIIQTAAEMCIRPRKMCTVEKNG